MTRKTNERIFIGTGPDAVVVRVLRITRDHVRLLIEAPAEVQVDREEVRARKEGQEVSPRG